MPACTPPARSPTSTSPQAQLAILADAARPRTRRAIGADCGLARRLNGIAGLEPTSSSRVRAVAPAGFDARFSRRLAPLRVPHRRRVAPRATRSARPHALASRPRSTSSAMNAAAARACSACTTGPRTASRARARRPSARCRRFAWTRDADGVLVARGAGRRVLPQHGALARRRLRRRSGRASCRAARLAGHAGTPRERTSEFKVMPADGPHPRRGRLPARRGARRARGADPRQRAPTWRRLTRRPGDRLAWTLVSARCARHPLSPPPLGSSAICRARNAHRSGIHEHLTRHRKQSHCDSYILPQAARTSSATGSSSTPPTSFSAVSPATPPRSCAASTRRPSPRTWTWATSSSSSTPRRSP